MSSLNPATMNILNETPTSTINGNETRNEPFVIMGHLNAEEQNEEELIEKGNGKLKVYRSPYFMLHELRDAHLEKPHTLVFSILQRNLHLLPKLVQEVSAPNYSRRHFTRAEVAELTSDRNSTNIVERFLRSQGGDVIITDSLFGEHITATAPIRVWSKLLRANFKEFHIMPSYADSSLIRAIEVTRALSYSLPVSVAAVVHVVRNTVQILPFAHRFFPTTTKPFSLRQQTTGGSITPSKLMQAYGITTSAGSMVASQQILTLNTGSIPSYVSEEDLKIFQNHFNLPEQSISNFVNEHFTSGICTESMSCNEANLDMQYLMALSQGSHNTHNYHEDVFSWIVSESALAQPSIVTSISYAYHETHLIANAAYLDSFNTEIMKLSLQGVTVVAASGDDGVANFVARGDTSKCSYGNFSMCNIYRVYNVIVILDYTFYLQLHIRTWIRYVDPIFPASNPYVLAVGGTQGVESGLSEVAAECSGARITSGGGFSGYFAAPARYHPFYLPISSPISE